MPMKTAMDPVKAQHKHSHSTGSMKPQPSFPSPMSTPQHAFPKSFSLATDTISQRSSSCDDMLMASDMSDMDSEYDYHCAWKATDSKQPRAGTDPQLGKTIGMPDPSHCCAHRCTNGSGELEERFQHIFICMREAGFESFDDMVLQYYTADFLDTSAAHLAQKTSRGRKLPSVLAGLRSSARDWTRWEAQGYEDEIIKSAENLYISELERSRQNPENNKWPRWNHETNGGHQLPPQEDRLWASLEDHVARGLPIAHLISEAKRSFQNGVSKYPYLNHIAKLINCP